MEGDRQAQDFETMLRVRLERRKGRMPGRDGGGSEWNAASCRGFDPERANAFLEGALSVADAARYEDHLTGCLVCRQAMIELNRMPGAASAPLTQPLHVSSRPSVVQAGWFQAILKSLRTAPFQWAGAAAATCGLVIVFSIFLRMSTRISEPSPSASMVAGTAPVVQTSPLADAAPQVDTLTSGANESAASKSNSVPLSSNGQIANQRGLVSQPVLPKTESLDLIFGRAPNRQIAQLSPGLAGTAPQFNVPYNAPSVSPQLVPQNGPQITPPMAQAIPPSPQAVQEQTELMRTDSLVMQSKDQAQRPAARESADKRKSSSTAMDFLPKSFLKGLPTPSPTPNIADEDIHPMIRKVGDKTFRLERGKWIDQQFKAGLLYKVRIRVERGSDEYKKILSDIPSLQVFFDLGPVIVVWEFKVYEVLR